MTKQLTDEQRALAEGNIRLAKYIANRYCWRTPLKYDDLLSICYESLCKAVLSFKPDKGFAFSTYATRIMTNDITLALNNYKKNTQALYLEELIESEWLNWESAIPSRQNTNSVITDGINPQAEIKVKLILNNLRDFSGTQREKAAVINFIRNPFLSQQEIAQKAGVSQSRVGIAIARFRERLCKQLTEMTG